MPAGGPLLQRGRTEAQPCLQQPIPLMVRQARMTLVLGRAQGREAAHQRGKRLIRPFRGVRS